MQTDLFNNVNPGYFLFIGLAAGYACLSLIVLFTWLSSRDKPDDPSTSHDEDIAKLRRELEGWTRAAQTAATQGRQVKIEVEQLRMRVEDLEHSLDEHLSEVDFVPEPSPVVAETTAPDDDALDQVIHDESTTHEGQLSVFTPAAEIPVTKSLSSAIDPDLGLVYLEAPQTPDDLTMIWGIGGVNQTRLQENGIYFFHQIAQWTPRNIEKFDELLMFKGRIERETWVQQAQRLCGKSVAA